MKVAFYKGTRPGVKGLYNRLVRWWTGSPYSHCEIIFSDGVSGGSSFEDKGVRFKDIDYDLTRWDIVEFPAYISKYLEPGARKWFVIHEHEEYDVWGNVHFVAMAIGHSLNKWSCAEAVMAALGFKASWTYYPGSAHAALTSFFLPEGIFAAKLS